MYTRFGRLRYPVKNIGSKKIKKTSCVRRGWIVRKWCTYAPSQFEQRVGGGGVGLIYSFEE